jgi:hypothetical protein
LKAQHLLIELTFHPDQLHPFNLVRQFCPGVPAVSVRFISADPLHRFHSTESSRPPAASGSALRVVLSPLIGSSGQTP